MIISLESDSLFEKLELLLLLFVFLGVHGIVIVIITVFMVAIAIIIFIIGVGGSITAQLYPKATTRIKIIDAWQRAL